MKRTELDWFQLRFPRDLEDSAALAALASFSGLPRATRLVLEMRATSSGISHRLGVSPSSREAVTGALRAAIPSLRLESIATPTVTGRRSIWQLAPRTAALRTEDLAASSAALLASLFPLRDGESMALRWRLRPAPRPLPPRDDEGWPGGRLKALRAKLTLPGISGFGELSVSAPDGGRQLRLMQRTASVLRSLGTPYGRLVGEPLWLALPARWLGQRGRYFSSAELAAVIGWPLSSGDVPGLELGAAKRLVPSSRLATTGRTLGTSDFAGLARPVALTAKASTRGLWVLGPTGSGKTSLLKNLIRDDLEQGRGLAVLETNGDLITELLDVIPAHRIRDVVFLDPTDQEFAVGFNPLATDADPALIADQIGELFERIWSAFWGPRTAQLAHMGLLTLAKRKNSTLLDLPRLYLDPVFRARLLTTLDDPVGLDRDWRWFESLPQREQTLVVSPLLNKSRAFAARPAVRAIIGQSRPPLSIKRLIEDRKVLLVHLPKGLIGSETAQLVGCLVLSALWQAMTERVALAPNKRHPFGLYVDELQDFADAPVPWDEMFAQGRKYGLSLTGAHQNLEQLPRELRETIQANARSKAVFALSASDARAVERLFAPALSAADLQALDPYAIAALVALDDGGTARPVTLTTPPPPKSLGSAGKVRAASRSGFARKRSDVEATLRKAATGPRTSTAPVGRRPRRESP